MGADPKQTQPIAIQNDTSKEVRQNQIGTVLEHQFDPDTVLSGRVYYGVRHLDNALGIPLAAQTPPTSAGGIVSFDRDYDGVGLQLSHRFALGPQASARLLGGLTYDRMHDDRQGYINNNGERGALKRDEDDYVYNTDALLQGTVDVGDAWSGIAGVRATRVHFRTDDHFIAPGNPDDSGTIDYRGTNPVIGVTWHAAPDRQRVRQRGARLRDADLHRAHVPQQRLRPQHRPQGLAQQALRAGREMARHEPVARPRGVPHRHRRRADRRPEHGRPLDLPQRRPHDAQGLRALPLGAMDAGMEHAGHASRC